MNEERKRTVNNDQWLTSLISNLYTFIIYNNDLTDEQVHEFASTIQYVRNKRTEVK